MEAIKRRMTTPKKQPSKRRGKVVKDKDGKAVMKPGDAAAPKVFDAAAISEGLHLFWEDGDGQTFVIGGQRSEVGGQKVNGKNGAAPQVWSRWPERKILNLLRTKYVRVKPREGETLSEAERLLLHVMQERRLALSIGALAGYGAGIYEIGGERVLVRTSPRLVAPREGDWGVVKALIDGKLNLSLGSGGPDQTVYFHGWMKTALEGIYLGGPGNFRPGQCCIFAGPRDSGKSRVQHQVITGLLGGRSADPGPYLFGRTDFNGEMFSSEHLMMEDPASSTKTVDRVYFGEMLKQLIVNDTQRLHRKREDAMVVSPFFRTTISINDDPDKMRVLPLLTPDMKDKVHLFLISDSAAAPLPMPTNTLDERAAFRRTIGEQLAAYAWWLLHVFEIPEALRSVRFGVREWHHPGLAIELFDDTPAAELLQVIDAADFTVAGGDARKLWELDSASKQVGDLWEGTAIELEQLLTAEAARFAKDEEPTMVCSVAREAKKIAAHNKVDRLLARLKEDQSDRVAYHRMPLERRWIISRPV